MTKFSTHFKLSKNDIVDYVLEKLDIFDQKDNLKVEEIGDGNINYVFRISDKKSGKSLVVKQSDTLLKSSGRPLDIDRNRIEAEVLELQESLAPGFTPKIYLYDPVMCAISMEDIGGHENLRLELLKGQVFPKFADQITTFIVNALLPTTDLVMDSGEKKDMVAKYINKDLCKISEDLVFTEPYIDYKGRNIVIEENLDFIKREIYEDKDLILEAGKLKNNFMNNAQALIHGDLHSGSIFLNKESTKVLDPEFAFYGPIGYDLGNVIGNIFFAWANIYFTRKDSDSKEFLDWVEKAIEDIVSLFKEKFIKLYKDIVKDVMAKEEKYMEWYLESILKDTAGSAGLEIIRRVVGDSKVLDITGIEDTKDRVKVEKVLLLTAKEFIKDRDGILSGKAYTDIFKKHLKDFK